MHGEETGGHLAAGFVLPFRVPQQKCPRPHCFTSALQVRMTYAWGMQRSIVPRRGFVLVEALMALLVLSIAYLVLEGSWMLVSRNLFDSNRMAAASRMEDVQRERALARGCVASSGADSAGGIAMAWRALPSRGVLQIGQTRTYRRDGFERADSSNWIASCR